MPTAASGWGLEFYKVVHFPWSQGIVKDHIDWDSYFDGLLRADAKNFVLHGYRIKKNKILDFQFGDWDKSRFMSLKKRVQAKGGNILADLTYPVDGLTDAGSSVEQVADGHLFHSGRSIPTSHGHSMATLTCAARSFHYTWNEALETGIPQLADVNVAALDPSYEALGAEQGLFITGAIAEKAI
ncbi:hypothetical protein FOZ63_028225 [Perkinsus olseni]|uniref:Uncharacterized protein n=1 Tax=Perkinsus olseni TaxID=32597 RepID=A0A7J6R648_PEROL|nr:hypothetical protein FOZ63_028225 [Perkinsus olseni]